MRAALLIALLLPALSLAASARPADPDADTDADTDPAATTVVFLVRHAEKELDGSRDPALTAAGEARADELARVLGRRIDRVHSTDFRRTRATAAPTAAAVGAEVEIYDPSRLEELAAGLRAAPGRHLVVGHSDTTPELLRALGGEVGEPVTEEHYDRLWIVVLPPDGPPSSPPTTVELRYGEPIPTDGAPVAGNG